MPRIGFGRVPFSALVRINRFPNPAQINLCSLGWKGAQRANNRRLAAAISLNRESRRIDIDRQGISAATKQDGQQ
jgi:hypothetical protein